MFSALCDPSLTLSFLILTLPSRYGLYLNPSFISTSVILTLPSFLPSELPCSADTNLPNLHTLTYPIFTPSLPHFLTPPPLSPLTPFHVSLGHSCHKDYSNALTGFTPHSSEQYTTSLLSLLPSLPVLAFVSLFPHYLPVCPSPALAPLPYLTLLLLLSLSFVSSVPAPTPCMSLLYPCRLSSLLMLLLLSLFSLPHHYLLFLYSIIALPCSSCSFLFSSPIPLLLPLLVLSLCGCPSSCQYPYLDSFLFPASLFSPCPIPGTLHFPFPCRSSQLLIDAFAPVPSLLPLPSSLSPCPCLCFTTPGPGFTTC